MLARAAPTTCTPNPIPRISGLGVLTFLYCTRTILRPYRSQSSDKASRIRAPRSSPKPKSEASDGEELGGLLAEWDKKRATKRHRQDHAFDKQRRSQFGKDGFTVNESSDVIWKTFKQRPPPSSPSAGQKSDDDSYAPFAGWSGPSSDDVRTKPRKRILRDASQIPFERPKVNAGEDLYADLEGTTITPTEKKAFQALFELSNSSINAEAAAASATSSPEETKRQGRETSGKQNDSDKQTEGPARLHRPRPEFPEPLQRLRKVVASRDQDVSSRTSKRKTGKTTIGDDRLEKEQRWADQDVFDVKQLMRQANTDVEVWDILHSKVLDRVLALELDGPRSSPKDKKMKRSASNLPMNIVEENMTEAVEEEITAVSEVPQGSQGLASLMEEKAGHVEDSLLPAAQDETMEPCLATFEERTTDKLHSAHPQPAPLSIAERSLRHHRHAFPQHLRNTFRTLTDLFRGSPLPLNLVPLVKSLGPSTATLGLTTDLYNMHLQYHWHKYRDPLAIDAVLQEMDDDVYEFDVGTRNILLEILREIKSSRSGRLGTVAQVLSSMERSVTGFLKLTRWYEVMKVRSQNEALRRAQEREAMEVEERDEEGRARERERLRREALSDAAEQDEQASEALGEASEEDVGEQSEQGTTPAASPAI